MGRVINIRDASDEQLRAIYEKTASEMDRRGVRNKAMSDKASEPDWADQRAAELLPCNGVWFEPDGSLQQCEAWVGTGQKHLPDCASQYRWRVAQALRDSEARAEVVPSTVPVTFSMQAERFIEDVGEWSRPVMQSLYISARNEGIEAAALQIADLTRKLAQAKESFEQIERESHNGSVNRFNVNIVRIAQNALAQFHDLPTLCLWTPNSDGFYDTSCGQAFTLSNEAGLVANGFKFCYSCGKKIEETGGTLEDEDADSSNHHQDS